MKIIHIILFLLGSVVFLISCNDDEAIEVPINHLVGTWKGNAILQQFTNDSLTYNATRNDVEWVFQNDKTATINYGTSTTAIFWIYKPEEERLYTFTDNAALAADRSEGMVIRDRFTLVEDTETRQHWTGEKTQIRIDSAIIYSTSEWILEKQ